MSGIADSPLSKKITVYNKNTRLNDSIIKAFKTVCYDVWSYRWLIWRLFKRDFTAPYKQSFLGVIWSFIVPIIPVTVYLFLVTMGVLRPSAGMPYLVFVFVGMTLWMFISGGMNSMINTMQKERNVIVKVKFPLVVVAFSGFGKVFLDTLVRIALVIFSFILYGIVPSWTIILLPVVLLPFLLLTFGLGIIVGLLDVAISDTRNVVDIFLRYGIFLSSVIFAMPTTGLIGKVNRFNIFNQFIVGIREFLVYGYITDLAGFVLSSVGAFVIFILAIKILYTLEYKILGHL